MRKPTIYFEGVNGRLIPVKVLAVQAGQHYANVEVTRTCHGYRKGERFDTITCYLVTKAGVRNGKIRVREVTL